MSKKKGSKASSSQAKDIIKDMRSNPLETGLYFVLADNYPSCKNSALTAFFNKHKIRLDKSSPNSQSGRESFYLNLPKPQESLFPQSDYEVSAHISIDRKFYEGEGGLIDPEVLKWPYCHYTFEHREKTTKELVCVVHVDYNSLLKIFSCRISNYVTNKEEVVEIDKLYMISDSISDCTKILKELFCIKEEMMSDANYQAGMEFSDIRDELRTIPKISIEKAHQLRRRYQAAKDKANRYADTQMLFSEPDQIKDIIDKQNLTDTESSSHADEQDQYSTTSNYAQDASEKLKLFIIEKDRIKDELDKINKNPQKLYNRNKIAKLEESLFKLSLNINELLGETKDKELKQLLTVLQKIQQTIDDLVLSRPIKNILTTEKITEEFLRDNFLEIETDISEEFCFEIIHNAINLSNSKEPNKFINICEFLSLKSRRYLDTVDSTNKLPSENNNSASSLLKKCINRDAEQVFRMLLRHGIDMQSLSDTKYALGNNTKTLFYEIALYIQYQILDSETPLVLLKYLDILLEPQFYEARQSKNLHLSLDKQTKLNNLRAIKEGRRKGVIVKTLAEQHKDYQTISFLNYCLVYSFPLIFKEKILLKIDEDKSYGDIAAAASIGSLILSHSQLCIFVKKDSSTKGIVAIDKPMKLPFIKPDKLILDKKLTLLIHLSDDNYDAVDIKLKEPKKHASELLNKLIEILKNKLDEIDNDRNRINLSYLLLKLSSKNEERFQGFENNYQNFAFKLKTILSDAIAALVVLSMINPSVENIDHYLIAIFYTFTNLSNIYKKLSNETNIETLNKALNQQYLIHSYYAYKMYSEAISHEPRLASLFCARVGGKKIIDNILKVGSEYEKDHESTNKAKPRAVS